MADIIRDIQNDMMRSGLGSVLKEEEAREALTTVADALHGSTETLEAVLQDESIIPPERLMDWSMRLGIRLPDTATPLERSVAVQRALLHSEAHDAHEGIVRDLLDDPHVTAGILQDLEWKISQYDELMRIVPSAANSIPPEGIASLGSTAISINPPTEREPFDGVRPEHSAPLNRLQSDFRKFRTKLGQKGVGYEWLEEDSARLPAMPQDTYRQIDFSDVRQRYIRSLHERKELVGKLLKAQLELRIREHQRTLSRYANEVLFATSTPGVPKQKERVYWPDFSTNIAEFTIAVREKRLDALSATVKALDLGERSSTVIQQTLSELDEQQKLFDALESVGAEDFTDPIDAKKNILFAEEIADQRFFDQWVRDVAPQAREILNALPTWPEDARLFVREQGYAEMLESVLAFDEVKDAETADGRRTPRGFAEAVPVTVRQQEDIRMIVALLQYGDPQLLPHAAERLERSQEQRRDTIDTALAAENLERQRHDVEARLSVQLAHPVADELDVKAALQRHYGRIDNAVRHLRGRDDGSGRTTGPAAQELLADAEEILNVLETCALQLENVRVEELEDAEYKPIGGNSNGVYRASNRTCYINATKLRDRYPDTATRAYARERLLSHERGHAILHILQTTVCPGLLFDMRAALAESTAGAHPPTDEELVSIAERNNWGIGRRDYDRLFRSAHSQTGSEDMARKAAIRPFLDELVNKYVSWKAKGRPSVNQETWELFGALDARTPPQEKKEIPYYEALELFENDMEPSAVGDPRFQNHVVDAAPSGVRDVSDQVNRRTHRTDDEAEDASSPDAFPSGEPAAIDQDASNLEDAERSVSNPIKKIDETHRNVIAIKSFAKAYPEYQAQIDTILGEPNNLELRSQQVDDIYRKGYYFEKNGRKVQYPGAERDPAYLAKLDKIHAYSEEIKKLITSIDEEKSNLTDLPPQNVMGIKALWNSIRWLSVLDIIKIAQDTKEDYLDMWRRFQQRKTSDVEYALAQWIPDSVPYLGMFKHYFDRRANQAELDDVQKWQNAFQNKDYYQLRAGLQNTPNQDQLKAIMNLLAQSGHINWSDENLWASLSSFSKYTIPVEPCRRDNNLRDEYLQKLITDIWNDKDLYVTWKNQNDNAINSKKSEFNTTADSYANTGLLAPKLKTMLQTYVEYTQGARAGESMPAFVNEHHYEEMLSYAMRVGKLSMEDKFFYLIQGVRYGLLPVERLQVLGGEKLGLLSAFPFLEFFYRKNNTLPEVRAIGAALDEAGDPFNPGLKTTLFLRTIVLRDPGTRTRIIKAGNRRGEGFDHEDMPYILTDITHGFLKNLTGNINAGQQKLSPQSMQNGYVGFNEKFKVFAKLVEMEEDGVARFTEQDAEDMAITIATYVQFDNMITKWGTDSQHGYLSPAELDNEVPPAGSFVTSAYRNRTRDFVDDLTRNLGITEVKGKGERISREELIASKDRDRKLPPGNTKRQMAIYESIDDLVLQLKKQILADRGQALKNTLRDFERETGFLYTGSSGLTKQGADNKMATENVERVYLDLTRGLNKVEP